MRINLDLDLGDFLKEDFDYDEENSTLRLKDDCEMRDTITKKIVDYIIIQNIRYELKFNPNNVINNFIKENKQQIIDEIIREVSDKIILTKKIDDFKKSILEE